MTDQELRDLVRDAIARRNRIDPQTNREETGFDRRHASHLLLPLARGSEGDGACLIEPAVRCTHCGYCLSYGH